MPVIDVHTHMFTTRWLELLQQEGGDYNLQTRPDGQREIFRGNTPVVIPQKGHFDWDLRVQHMDQAGIDVSVENSEWTAYWDKLATSTAANDSPDVVQMDESYIAAYGTRSALADLGALGDDLDLSAMDPKVLETGTVDGTQVGAPIGVANFSIAVNPTVLEKAGVAMPDDKPKGVSLATASASS